MTDAESPDLAPPAEPGPASDESDLGADESRLASLDLEAGRVDTAMVLGWVGLATVPCCGLGGLISLAGIVLGIIRLRRVAGRDRRLSGRAAGAIVLGVIGFLLGAAIVTWFAMSFTTDFTGDEAICMVISC